MLTAAVATAPLLPPLDTAHPMLPTVVTLHLCSSSVRLPTPTVSPASSFVELVQVSLRLRAHCQPPAAGVPLV
jgi:hypothetical protein